MATCNPGRKLCGNFKVYFVTGYKASSSSSASSQSSRGEEVEEAYNQIRGWFGIIGGIFNPRFEEIINTTCRVGDLFSLNDPEGLKHNSSRDTVRAIRAAICRPGALCNCGKITSVFITHSHGSMCFDLAVRHIDIYPSEAYERMNRTAVFSIGGIVLLPNRASKVAANYCFTNDSVVCKLKPMFWKDRASCTIHNLGPFRRTGKKLDEFTCDCCDPDGNCIQCTDDQSLVDVPPVSMSARNQMNLATNLVLGRHVNGAIKAHYIHDYVCCGNLGRSIKEHLGLS